MQGVGDIALEALGLADYKTCRCLIVDALLSSGGCGGGGMQGPGMRVKRLQRG